MVRLSMVNAMLDMIRYLPNRIVAGARVGAAGPGQTSGSDLSNHIGEHTFVCIFPHTGGCAPSSTEFIGSQINLDTIVMTLISMAIVLALALIVRGRLSLTRPRGVQNVLEYSFEFVNGFVADSLGNERVKSIGPLAVALFLLILIANLIGEIPVPLPGGFWHSPTSDINTTIGYALMVFVLLQILAVRARHGGGYFKHFFEPYWWLFPINLIEEITRPLTLAFRLFGNIFAGEVLLLVFGALLGSGFLLVGLPIADWLGFVLNTFIDAIQAFIFAVLTVAYIGLSTSTEGH